MCIYYVSIWNEITNKHANAWALSTCLFLFLICGLNWCGIFSVETTVFWGQSQLCISPRSWSSLVPGVFCNKHRSQEPFCLPKLWISLTHELLADALCLEYKDDPGSLDYGESDFGRICMVFLRGIFQDFLQKFCRFFGLVRLVLNQWTPGCTCRRLSRLWAFETQGLARFLGGIYPQPANSGVREGL